ncbi:hypothetical protein [Gemmobacter sp.]|uniref:hypothetical protein n=1 Tax=Gemmobacter sp. TaxID=1898957 RepID=UPI002AFFF254|nr:hypothetical protein [Gemmobacter sp.]
MDENASYDQIKGAVGSLLLLWSAIERTAHEEVARASGGNLLKSTHGVGAALNSWEASVCARRVQEPFRALLASVLRLQLRAFQDVRNGVCHGLVGVSAAHSGQQAALSWEIDGGNHELTWGELQVMFQWLSRVPAAISIISDSSVERIGSRVIDSPENHQWWLDEYGVDLLAPSLAVAL